MRLLGLLVGFAVGKKSTLTTWFIDGNNLMGHRGTPKDPDTIANKLQPIQGADAVILVFDGGKGDTTRTESLGSFQRISLGEDDVSADDYILREIKALMDELPRRRVDVVTADRDLRRRVLASKPIVRSVVNPVTFWRRYLPRLSGLKQRKAEAEPDEG